MKVIFGLLIFFPLFAFAEQAPEPEYPYPKTKKEKGLGIEKPVKVDSQGAYYYNTERKKSKSYQGVEQPVKVDDRGVYYYDTDAKKKKPKNAGGIEQPVDSDSEGAYYYSRKKKKKKPKVKYGEFPDKVLKDGTYVYNMETQPTGNVLYIRGGVYGPPDLKPTQGTRNYESVYTDSSSFVIQLEYDWKLTSQLYLKAGTGFLNEKGTGQFGGSNNPSRTPRETFELYIFPNTVSASYKFKLSEDQLFTPYVDAGLGYFTFMEIRSDGDGTRFGGAPVGTFVGGLMFSLKDFMDGSSLTNDYGITDTWLDIQYRQVLGLDSRKDFTSSMITGGFAIGFQ